MTISSTQFHPMRYARSRPYASEFVSKYVPRFLTREPSPREEAALTAVIAHPFEAMLPRLGATAPSMPSLFVATETELARSFATYTACGRNIFALSSELVRLLGGTDLGDVQLEDLHLPFESFYLGFGDCVDAELTGAPNRVDGAYVEAFANGIQILITTRRLDMPAKARGSWVSHSEPTYKIFLERGTDEPIEALLDRFIDAHGGAALQCAIECIPFRRDFGEPYASEDPVAWAWAANVHLRDNREVAKEVLALTLNALCYFASSAGQEELRTEEKVLPSDAPQDVVRAAQRGRSSHREAAEKRLAAGGYVGVKLLGRSIRPLARGAEGGSGRSVRPHWRRGHPRRQAYGPGRREYRIIRIGPTLVRADLGEPAFGHVYSVG